MNQTTLGDGQRPRTHVFMVRVWLEDLGDGNAEWRGQLKHVLSGQARYFRDWPMLINILQEMLAELEEAAKNAGRTLPEVIIPKRGRNSVEGGGENFD